MLKEPVTAAELAAKRAQQEQVRAHLQAQVEARQAKQQSKKQQDTHFAAVQQAQAESWQAEEVQQRGRVEQQKASYRQELAKQVADLEARRLEDRAFRQRGITSTTRSAGDDLPYNVVETPVLSPLGVRIQSVAVPKEGLAANRRKRSQYFIQ
ncbi:hypothetical protein HaLaN_17720, partial [Haematococcus lacustris]